MASGSPYVILNLKDIWNRCLYSSLGSKRCVNIYILKHKDCRVFTFIILAGIIIENPKLFYNFIRKTFFKIFIRCSCIWSQITRRWYALSQQFLDDVRNRERLPSLVHFCWHIDPEGNSTLSMILAAKYFNYFGGHSFIRKCADSKAVRHKKLTCLNVNFFQLLSIDSGSMFHGDAHRDKLHHIIAKLFRRCSSIDKLELRMDITERTTEVDVARNASKDLKIVELALTGQPSLRHFNMPNGIG